MQNVSRKSQLAKLRSRIKLSACCVYIVLLYCVATSTAAAKITDQPGDGSMEKLYLLNPENSKTFLILFQPKMCKNAYVFFLELIFQGQLVPPQSLFMNLFSNPPYCRGLVYGNIDRLTFYIRQLDRQGNALHIRSTQPLASSSEALEELGCQG